MGIFSSIKEKLFGKASEEKPVETAAAETISAEAVKPVTADVSATATTASNEAVATTADNTPAASSSPVDVAAIMDAAVKKNGQKLDWRRSIVDTMKALDLDSSLSARKELADELGYTGDKNDSATMNIWLHKALMKALAENGGKVPAELLD
ncbi:DUF3597 domain-containing protein [Shinella yambaruensis]|uniref:DUF3597 domain-containing protein n=1 Tax=Shinella yambaruensis TaxID=415996 RepID=A0ABQ5ZQT3_9HYPH|nr:MULTISPECIES: DUF3597 domain-containing protein [Shinella]CAI0341479.1 conserved hypothetical protein [Rhizobiaceae bacterium]CAK7261108.1 DUF3597 family protein [Shinella sp. WSC3-e]MCJ8029237.1 DUF3597 domain-containing protein [Shinella yambaruensis]MCO5141207.1 DUF3597 domain-containing protein [Shinella sp.]MCU7983410.1 DUF3597 domain-containing protein [Shinella yambaruensis]